MFYDFEMANIPENLTGKFNQNPLEGYYFIRVYNSKYSPFSTVSDLDDDAAGQACRETSPGRIGGDDYMHKRRVTEDWLREGAKHSGVNLDRANPVYFGMTKDPESFVSRVKNGEKHPTFAEDVVLDIVVLEAEDIDLRNWSFTMNDHYMADLSENGPDIDSFAGIDIPPHPLHGRVLNGLELIDFIRREGYENKPPHIIEAQMWAHAPDFLDGCQAAASPGGRMSVAMPDAPSKLR